MQNLIAPGKPVFEAAGHTAALLSSITDLIGGFIDPGSTPYIVALNALQAQIDQGLVEIQRELRSLISDIKEDFLKVLLAPGVNS